ncbi:hypothetical protein C5B42_04125 [Candidatus Cerribacteria bacterium 'Amazon FNV 2010 28 9']|uniref:Uncharacterized protein n=1 Tax=Candidatus Cerribacteria bacterium 'Amazon FNV 2010 28 9' TaxID=2081795 RepID=A0A317JT75_9BACT|nr:MAG: hypothetical protein C5B42_04125 [Candidatus Cerribacteria bacterium 'Amazon FNV 2010 28 9']
MNVLILIFSIMWTLFAVFVTSFSLWRKLSHERVGQEEKVFDTLLEATVLSVVVARLAFIFIQFSIFHFSFDKWIDIVQFPGSLEGVGLCVLCISFVRLLGETWRDRVEITDYVSISLALFLFLHSLGNGINALFLNIGAVVTGGSTHLSFLGSLILFMFSIVYLGLYLFLNKIEKEYRTFMWYRSSRRSAQTGFVVACFFIGYGLIGFLLGWFTPSVVTFAGINFDPLLKLLVMVGGVVVLYVRSGRTLFKQK